MQELCFFARSKLIFSLNVFANTWVTLGVTEQQALHRKSLINLIKEEQLQKKFQSKILKDVQSIHLYFRLTSVLTPSFLVLG